MQGSVVARSSGAEMPGMPDLWAPVGLGDLPTGIRESFEAGDWDGLRRELSTVMDGAISDGPLGRALLQLVQELPTGFDAVFDRYRGMAMLDHGNWDGLRKALPAQSIEPIEIRGKRDIFTAPVDRADLPDAQAPHHRWQFELWEFLLRNSSSAFKHWVQRHTGHYPPPIWDREDVPLGRHLRYRQLLDTFMLAVAESVAGRLPVAHALASDATRLGDDREPVRSAAADLADLARLGMGDRIEFELRVPARICEPTGPSPMGAGEMLLYILPLLSLRVDDSLRWAAELLGVIAARLAVPRWQIQADSFRIADDLRGGVAARKTALAGLLVRARRAAPGLKALPVFLQGFADRRLESFEEAEALARRSGNVWLQLSALAWMIALDPKPRAAMRMRQLIEATGWRRLALVPSEVAGDAALGMTSMGEQSEAILELALTADRPNVTTELIRRYLDDTNTPANLRLAAVDALARVGTTHSREILSRLAQRRDEVGKAAASAQQRPGVGLSEREIEVLSLAADGLTNKQIGEKLFLSHHTIARHLANARAKLGASNRAEAAVRLHRAGVD